MMLKERTRAVLGRRPLAELAAFSLALAGISISANAAEHAVYITTNAAGDNRELVFRDGRGAPLQFDESGDTLVVTEKATNQIALYLVDEDGVPSGPQVVNSAGHTPFGFAIDRHDHLLVSEAFGGAVGASALSSYEIEDDGIEVESASAPTHQTAASWGVVTARGSYAYTTNTGSGTVTGYRVLRGGDLQPLTTSGATGVTGSGSGPTDAALTP